MSKLNIGIIGCGGIANQKHFPAMKNNSDLCRIVAFCDIVRERAGAPSSTARRGPRCTPTIAICWPTPRWRWSTS